MRARLNRHLPEEGSSGASPRQRCCRVPDRGQMVSPDWLRLPLVAKDALVGRCHHGGLALRTKLPDLMALEAPVALSPTGGRWRGTRRRRSPTAAVSGWSAASVASTAVSSASWRSSPSVGQAMGWLDFVLARIARGRRPCPRASPPRGHAPLRRSPTTARAEWSGHASGRSSTRRTSKRPVIRSTSAGMSLSLRVANGSHGGGRPTLPFVPIVVDLAGPVLATGGIADGRDGFEMPISTPARIGGGGIFDVGPIHSVGSA